jgi:hypothetical protein
LPAETLCPPKRFTPRLWPALSRPFRELPAAFLCAMALLLLNPDKPEPKKDKFITKTRKYEDTKA